MPRRAAQRVVPVVATPPLAGCVIALSGKFESMFHNHASLEELIKELGGTFTKTIAKTTTHLVCTENDYKNASNKVVAALAKDLFLVRLQWIIDCQDQGKAVSTQAHLWHSPDASATKKRPVSSQDDDAEVGPETKKQRTADGGAEADAKPAPKVKAKAKVKSKSKAGGAAKGAAKGDDSQAKQAEDDKKKSLARIVKKITVPVDPKCPLLGCRYSVYIQPDSGVIYDASLNQTNASNNANKFYLLQLLVSSDSRYYQTWTRWGRVGENGQSALLGNGDLADATKYFEKKFREKSGWNWKNRGGAPIVGKYAFVERSYNPDDEDDEDGGEKNGSTKDVKEQEPEREPPPCTLEPAVQSLMELIFNKQLFQETMIALNYDVNKLPLGKLSKGNILRGFEQLKDLAALMDDPTLAASRWGMSIDAATEQVSNFYYSIIPHAFGRIRPPVIRDKQMLKKEVDLLESLSDMKAANDIMKVPATVTDEHVLDSRFKGLNLDEMTVLDPEGSEFRLLTDYLTQSCGHTHDVKYKVQEIFRIERRGEQDRLDDFTKKSRIGANRRLLWHGSRVTNFGGILSQGLRIAPPEAPATGYMFGKGIYLADMSSKSAGYCYHHSSMNNALLLLCEAKLGDPILQLTRADCTADTTARGKGCESTQGMGRFAPLAWTDAAKIHPNLSGVMMPDASKGALAGATNYENAGLMYNEYICYDVAQVKLRYLFRVKM